MTHRMVVHMSEICRFSPSTSTPKTDQTVSGSEWQWIRGVYPSCAKTVMKIFPLLFLLAWLPAALHAQSIDDGIMMRKHELFTGFVYSHDRWDEYWEGSLKRSNGNIGTVTTQTSTWSANYGITNRLNCG